MSSPLKKLNTNETPKHCTSKTNFSTSKKTTRTKLGLICFSKQCNFSFHNVQKERVTLITSDIEERLSPHVLLSFGQNQTKKKKFHLIFVQIKTNLRGIFSLMMYGQYGISRDAIVLLKDQILFAFLKYKRIYIYIQNDVIVLGDLIYL